MKPSPTDENTEVLESPSQDSLEKLDLKTSYNEEDLPNLTDATYQMSSDTLKKDGHLDAAMTFCAVFALICMIVLIIRGITLGGMNASMIIMCIVYLLLAVLLFPKPLQYKYYRFIWKCNMRKRLNPSETIALYKDHITFPIKDRVRTASFKHMEAIYKLPGYYIFQISSSRIIAIQLAVLEEAFSDRPTSGEAYIDSIVAGKLTEYVPELTPCPDKESHNIPAKCCDKTMIDVDCNKDIDVKCEAEPEVETDQIAAVPTEYAPSQSDDQKEAN